MKPVESYSAINTRLDRPALKEAGTKAVGPANDTGNAGISSTISTTASKLAAQKPSFDSQKVSEIKQQIASGRYAVDTDALASRMLDSGVLGVDSKT